MQLTMVFSQHLHPVQAKLQEQAVWDGGCVQNWPNLVFSLASLKVKTQGRSSLSFSPLQTKPEPEGWGKRMCYAYQRQCAPKDEAGLVGMGRAVTSTISSTHPRSCLQHLPDLYQGAGAHSISKAPCWESWCLAARRDAFECRYPWPNTLPDTLSMFSVKTHFCP